MGSRNPILKQHASTTKALAMAKELVIAHAVTNTLTPGGLTFPDRNSDNNYDGNGDCVSSGFNETLHLLGKWPYLDEQGCGVAVPAFDKPLQDGSGETLWYAVSRHLVKVNSSYPVLNSEILNQNNGWLTVVNGQGTVLTNRAAVVIMAPGGVIQTQDRAGAAPAATQFLEGITINGTTFTNYAFETGDTGFVARPADDTTNDQLIYITIDELMTAVEQRVTGEFKKLINDYHTACGKYPWPRPYSDPRTASDFNSVIGTMEGLLPTGTASPSNWGDVGITVPTWLLLNYWHHLCYYALASTTVQDGGTCTPGLDCLTVDGLDLPNDDKKALVILAGKELSGQTRNTFTGLTDYFEGQNASSGDNTFETKAADSTFNDRLEVVQ
ncbi:MAG: hypothetical protein KJ990_00390 [Proteobacteria bacterium]|nr:hypothetical protein [Pseudomonadota bacterium]MBU1648386.1 hypothetical protein [Pseudomonadota bacterium]